MKDTGTAARLELEDARLQAIYEQSMQRLDAARRHKAREGSGLVYLVAGLDAEGSQWNRMGSFAMKFCIVMLGVIPNLLVISVLL